MDKKRKLAYLLLTLTMAIWGGAIVVIKHTLQFIDPLPFLFYRFWFTTLILFPPFYLYVKKHPLTSKSLPRLFLLGFLGTTVNLWLLFEGMKSTTAINVSLISVLCPIMIVVGGALFLKEKVTPIEKVGLLVAVLGTIITLYQHLSLEEGASQNSLWGIFLVFISYFAWAAYTLLLKKDSRQYHPLVITFFNFFSGLITITPIFLLSQSFESLLVQPEAIPGLVYIVLLSSLVAYFTYNWGVSLIEASEAALFEYTKPIFVAPLAILWLGETITPYFFLGLLLIAVGVLLAEYRKGVALG